MIVDILGYVVSMATHILKEIIYRMLPVKELPQTDADGVQAKTIARVRIKKNGPVVKLLPEHDPTVGYGFFIVVHGSIRIFSDARCLSRG
jgi:hypothetical protein